MCRSPIITRGKTMKPIHPGRILKRELLSRNLSANKLALAIRVPSGRITQILNEKRAITAETALRLSRYFGNSARFWLNLQSRYELAVAEREIGAKIDSEIEISALRPPTSDLCPPTSDL
jgi:antitoxin HigA-1